MTINTQRLRDQLDIVHSDQCEDETQFEAAQQIIAAAPELLDRADRVEALDIIVLSVAAALARHGVKDADDPGEAIDVLVADKDREIARLRSEFDRANDALAAIGDFAHSKSTGPATPDALWEVRAMAYDAVRIPEDIDDMHTGRPVMIGNQHAEDLRRCCDMYAAENKRLRNALLWNAAALNECCKECIREASNITIADETKSFSEILDMADAALGQEQGESDAQE